MKDTKKCHRVKRDTVVRKISELNTQTPFSEVNETLPNR